MSQRRNNLDVTADILHVARDGAIKTHIVYKANLNFKLVRKYLTDLLERGLIVFRKPHYFTTEEGIDFIERYDALVSL